MPNNITKISETEIGVPKVEVISKDQLRNTITDLTNRKTQILENLADVQSMIDAQQALLDEADALEVKFSKELSEGIY